MRNVFQLLFQFCIWRKLQIDAMYKEQSSQEKCENACKLVEKNVYLQCI